MKLELTKGHIKAPKNSVGGLIAGILKQVDHEFSLMLSGRLYLVIWKLRLTLLKRNLKLAYLAFRTRQLRAKLSRLSDKVSLLHIRFAKPPLHSGDFLLCECDSDCIDGTCARFPQNFDNLVGHGSAIEAETAPAVNGKEAK